MFYNLLLKILNVEGALQHKIASCWCQGNYTLQKNVLKVSKSRKKLWCSQFFQKTNEPHYPEHLPFSKYVQDRKLCSFFGRIKNTINCFRDLVTFRLRCWSLPFHPLPPWQSEALSSILPQRLAWMCGESRRKGGIKRDEKKDFLSTYTIYRISFLGMPKVRT